jgi:hypothetical protein
MIIGFAITFFGLQIPNEIAFNISLGIFYASFLFSLVFAIIRLFKKDYLKGTLQLVGTLIIGGVSFLFLSILLFLYPFDFFADNLSVPKNVEFQKPIPLYQNDTVKTEEVNNADFILYDGIQPGIYKYDIYLNQIEKGKVYLKVYEITQNQILSEEDIQNRSSINVYNSAPELKRFKLKDDFTVYEGNWDQFYGSRIEVWFKPNSLSRPERKLMTKNYIIQGWER